LSILIDYLPFPYRNSPEAVEVQNVFQKWIEHLHLERDSLYDQFRVRSATWGLREWEKALGIIVDESISYEFRRSRIESKLRGFGTTTKEMIINVAASFSNGEVEVYEHNEEYYFDIRFIGALGLPPNMDDLTAVIEEIKPAHLAYAYKYRYRTHGELRSFTHAALSAYTHEHIRNGVI